MRNSNMEYQEWMKRTKKAAAQMSQFQKQLCLMDTEIGDGDHGITIARGYNSIENGVQITCGSTMENFCRDFGNALSMSMGGAIGPVYGIFWNAFAEVMAGKHNITTADMADALLLAVRKIGIVCQVKCGEKTIFDALISAAESMEQNRNLPLDDAMRAAEKAALEGSKQTINMIAKKGRAHFLGERSLGHVDAGAYSFYLWMHEWSEQLIK